MLVRLKFEKLGDLYCFIGFWDRNKDVEIGVFIVNYCLIWNLSNFMVD